jgi:hypothetical protein
MSADVDTPNRSSFQVEDDPQVSLDKGAVDNLSVGGGKFMYFVHPQSRIEGIPLEDLKGS